MSWNDELSNLKKVFRTGTTREKLDYIWTYYKWQLCIVAFILAFIGSMFRYGFSDNSFVLSGVLLGTNGDSIAADQLREDFLQKKPIGDPEAILIDASAVFAYGSDEIDPSIAFEAKQALMARIAAGEVDFMIAEQSLLCNYAYNFYFCELSEVLSADQMKKYEPLFLYYDRAVLEEIQNIDFLENDGQAIQTPDPTKPELMTDPVPIMLDISLNKSLSELYPDASKSYGMAIVVNGSNVQNVIELLDYLVSNE